MIKYCPNCGKEVTSQFCIHCGFNVGQFNTSAPQHPQQNSENLTEKLWFIVLLLFIFWPLGLIFMWQSNQFTKNAKIAITVAIAVLVVLYIILIVASEVLLFMFETSYYY